MTKIASRYIESDPANGLKALSANASRRRAKKAPYHRRGGDVLSRDRFLTQLHLEKRRADRSRAPLSVVTMQFADQGVYDEDDQRDILISLSLGTRETDVIGSLSDGVVAFLLPYTESEDAKAFAKMFASRTNTPAANVQLATYPSPDFDTLLVEALAQEVPAQSESSSSSGSSPRRENVSSFGAKRAIDVVGSLVLLVLASPFMLVTALAVRLTSTGPILFRQMRIGLGGEPFPFYKFRSMRSDSDDAVHREYVKSLIEGRHDQINEGDAEKPVYKMKSDPRITAVGRFIRRTSIDELPQLFNVLRGDMSLVGPRPPIPYEIEDYRSWHLRRLQEVRPGITGLWQVEGRSTTTFDEMVRLDLRYIRNWSLWLDIKILLKTVVVVIRCDGAD